MWSLGEVLSRGVEGLVVVLEGDTGGLTQQELKGSSPFLPWFSRGQRTDGHRGESRDGLGGRRT